MSVVRVVCASEDPVTLRITSPILETDPHKRDFCQGQLMLCLMRDVRGLSDALQSIINHTPEQEELFSVLFKSGVALDITTIEVRILEVVHGFFGAKKKLLAEFSRRGHVLRDLEGLRPAKGRSFTSFGIPGSVA